MIIYKAEQRGKMREAWLHTTEAEIVFQTHNASSPYWVTNVFFQYSMTEKIIEIEPWACPPKAAAQKHTDRRPLDDE